MLSATAKPLPSHPSGLLERISKLVGEPFEFEFSKYVYVPQSTRDDREYIRAQATEAAALYERVHASLGAAQEVALHSRIFKGSEELHIPMLDLAEEFSDNHLRAIRALMAEFGVKEFAVYHSGRSAHVYGLGLLSPPELMKFFGHALLLNLPGAAPLVDSRWIGHRVYAGYGSLRWSCNTKQYLSPPKAIGLFS